MIKHWLKLMMGAIAVAAATVAVVSLLSDHRDSGIARPSAETPVMPEPHKTSNEGDGSNRNVAPSTTAHYNIHDLEVSGFDSSSGSTQDVVIGFSLRREAILDAVAWDQSRRPAFIMLRKIKLGAGRHDFIKESLLETLSGVMSGSYFIDIIDTAPDNISRPYDAFESIQWKDVSTILLKDSIFSRFSYDLEKPSLVRLRILAPGGFAFFTIVNGEFRDSGPHCEKWNRRDWANRVTFPHDAGLQASLEIADLPSTLLHVKKNVSTGESGNTSADPRKGRFLPEPGASSVFYSMGSLTSDGAIPSVPPIRIRGDFPVLLGVHGDKCADKSAEFEVALPPGSFGNQIPSEPERFNVWISIDLQTVFMVENVILPYRHNRRTDKLSDGTHVISVMVKDPRGNAGLASVPFKVTH